MLLDGVLFDGVLFDGVFVSTPSQLNFDLVSLKDVSIKRVQSQTCLSFAEREKRLMQMKSKLLPAVVKQTFLYFASQDQNS